VLGYMCQGYVVCGVFLAANISMLCECGW
jgi:hypothetical protein